MVPYLVIYQNESEQDINASPRGDEGVWLIANFSRVRNNKANPRGVL